MRTIKCKRCDTRMWEDEDGAIYCPNCGWEIGTPVDDERYEMPEDAEWPA